MKTIEVNIAVIAVNNGHRKHLADIAAAGLYAVFIGSPPPFNIADISLESFHRAIAIKYPGDFEFIVFDSVTQKVIYPVNYESEHAYPCIKISNDVPEWLNQVL